MSWLSSTPYVDTLVDGVHAYVQPDGGWMINNTGIIVGPSGRTVLVDTSRDALIKELIPDVTVRDLPGRVVEWSRVPFTPPPGPRLGAFLGGFGQADAGRHPVRATARARINQFAEANNMFSWLRFFAIPR
jgi:hypothetical protein